MHWGVAMEIILTSLSVRLSHLLENHRGDEEVMLEANVNFYFIIFITGNLWCSLCSIYPQSVNYVQLLFVFNSQTGLNWSMNFM